MARIRLQAFPAQFTPTPFQNLAYIAEKKRAQQDALDTKIGKLKGEFASLVAAPGHEDLATGLTNDYNKKLTDLVSKYQNNLLSREFNRELVTLGTEFAANNDVQTVVKSRQFYEKFEPEMWKEFNRSSYIDAPGILRNDGTFEQNTQLYDMSKFKITPQAGWVQPIQAQYNIKKEAKFTEQKIIPQGVDQEGNPVYKTEDYQRIWNDPANRKEAALAIEKMVWDNTNTEPGFIYLRKTAERKYPNDLNAQKAFVRESIRNAGVVFDFSWTESKESTKTDTSGGTKPSKPPASATRIGVETDVSIDHMVDENGNRISSTEGLEAAANSYAAKITAKEGEISRQFPELINPDGTLNTNAFVYDDAQYKIINTNLIKNPLDKQNAEAYNAELRFYQNKEASTRFVMSHFAEEAGFAGVVKDKQGKLIPATPAQEVAATNPKLATQAINTAINNLVANPTYAKFFPKDKVIRDYTRPTTFSDHTVVTNDVYRPSDNYSFLLKKKLETSADIVEHIKLANNKMFAGKSPVDVETVYNGLSMSIDRVYSKADKRYKAYKDNINNYLATTIYTNAYNYSIVDGEDKRRIMDLIPAAVEQRKIERAKFGPDAEQYLADTEIEDIISNITARKAEDLDNKFSIRLDPSKGRFVLDFVTDKYGTLEIDGFDQNGLAEIVQKQDPKMSHIYLHKQSNLVSQLDASNGRYALYDVPIKDNAGNVLNNDRIVVKSALEGRGDIKQGDFLFTLPEISGKVLSTKNYWGLINFLDAYKELKQTGITGDALVKSLLNYEGVNLMNAYNVKSYQDRYNNVGNVYFPTAKSRVSPLSYGKGK